MSELINGKDRAAIRWNLLASVSAFALTAYVSSSTAALSEDGGRPQVWIELGGQLSRLGDGEETFSPSLMEGRPSIFSSSQPYETAPRFSVDEVGKITIQPDKSDWVFSASIRYGRSSSKRHAHQQTYPKPFVKYYTSGGIMYQTSKFPLAAKFADTNVQHSESHLILDFQVGKDVGLGLFGNKDATSVISAGVRFAQFTGRSNISLKSDPDWHFNYAYVPTVVSYYGFASSKVAAGQLYHSNLAVLRATRSFHGLGPSISWNASMPIVGNNEDGSIDVDWGLNAAVLFGRQKAQTHHQTTGRYHSSVGFFRSKPHMLHVTYQGPVTPDHTRSRRVTVPNVGGFAGLSWRVQDFKMSLGYKADFFLGAMDGGIDTRKTYDRNFYGPYATISIGLGG